MRILSVAVYFLGLIFSSFMMYLLVLCILIEFTAMRHLIFDGLHYFNVISFRAQDVVGTKTIENLLLHVSSGKYSFIYYACQGTMIFIGVNVLVYITGVWKVFLKITDGYQNYAVIGLNDPIRQKLFNVLGEIHNNAKSKLNIELPDYHKFDFEIEPNNEAINFDITPTQILRPTTKMLSYLNSNNSQHNEIFKAAVAHEIGHFVNKDTEIKQFTSGTNMISLLIRSTFEKLSPVKFCNGAVELSDALLSLGCFGVIFALPLLLIALFLWLAMIPGVLCLWINNMVTDYVINPLANLTNRQQEYRADTFAVKLGYGQGLFELFEELDRLHGRNASGFSWSRFFQDSHPTKYARQKNINNVIKNMGNP